MAHPRIFTSQTLAVGMELELDAGASRHLTGALRLRAGADITLFDGRGGEYSAQLNRVDSKRASATITNHDAIERESPLSIHLGICVSRGERMDWIVQKATELGVCQISPLLSERTEVKLQGPRAAKKIQHWQQIAISACEQSGRNRVPLLHPLQPLHSWCGQVQAACKLVLHHRSHRALAELTRADDLALLIGPEGGLSSAEISAAEQLGFNPLALGPRILRTETAPLAALAVLQHHWGDMA